MNLFQLCLILLALLTINFNISKEILTWVKSKSRIITLLAVLWFVPFVGAFCIYTKEDISPVWHYNANNANNVSQGSLLGSALLSLDFINNSAAKNNIEIVEQQKIQNNILLRQTKKQGYDKILKNLMLERAISIDLKSP